MIIFLHQAAQHSIYSWIFKKRKEHYGVECLALLGYVAITKHTYCLKPIIPFRTHGKIDPYNTLLFGVQTFFRSFRHDKKAMTFNISFTAIAATLVAFTGWIDDEN